ncbi:MAG TPA: DNA recombination protein RmuC [Anaerolineales bacterium]
MDWVLLAGLMLILALIVGLWLNANSRMTAITYRLIESGKLQEGTVESFGRIQQSMGALTEAGRKMEAVAEEVAGLSDLLKVPKVRGGVGELLLGDLLAQMLAPEQFRINHSFRSGERVDAVIKLQAGLVPVDAKFPLESFQRAIAAEDDAVRSKHKREFARALKGHINDIARKYILPDEGTFDFALMYIPAENVYYETIIRDEALGDEGGILTHALEKHVIPVSPNSFFAYLQAIALGFRGLQIEKRAKEIMGFLDRLAGDLARFRADYEVLGGHLDNARKKYDEADKRLGRFEEKLGGVRDPDSQLPGAETPRIGSDPD